MSEKIIIKTEINMIILFKIQLLLLLFKGRPTFSYIFLIITIIINTSIENLGFFYILQEIPFSHKGCVYLKNKSNAKYYNILN